MEIQNRYVEQIQNFSVILMVTFNSYSKLNQLARGPQMQEMLFMPPWIPGASLGLISHPNQIFLNTMQQSTCGLLMIWVIILKYLLSCRTNMVHISTCAQISSGTKIRITSLNIRLSIEHQIQRYTGRSKILQQKKTLCKKIFNQGKDRR